MTLRTCRLAPLLALLGAWLAVAPVQAAFPQKPITVVVHSKPGGAVDQMARMAAMLAHERRGATLVVENRFGGSGAVALRTVLRRPADGYTLLAFPATFVPSSLLAGDEALLDQLTFLACMAVAPEVLITRRQAAVEDLADIVADARARGRAQIWVGPGIGSQDHLMAVKTWQALGIQGTWIPYDGGGEAISALMGGHGTVYVGNPEDVAGRPDLRIAAVAAPARLPAFPEVPTFVEAGFDLPEESMWRGFALRHGTPAAEAAWLEDLLREIGQDPAWRRFIEESASEPVFLREPEFSALVEREQTAARAALALAGIVQEGGGGSSHAGLALALAVPLLGLGGLLAFDRRRFSGDLVIAAAMLGFAGAFAALSAAFPAPLPGQQVGAAAVPRLWAATLGGLALVLALRSARRPPPPPPRGQRGRVLALSGMLVAWVAGLPVLGFLASSAAFLPAGAYLLGYRRHGVIWGVAAGVILLCWVVFARVLGVPLPTGWLGV